MKRFMAAAVAFLSLAALATPTMAATSDVKVFPHQTLIQVKFRRHTIVGTIGVGTFRLDEAGVGFVDSTTCNSATAQYTVTGIAAGGADTTEPISLVGTPAPGILESSMNTTALTDTGAVAGAIIFADAGASGAVDTVFVIPQVSVDGKNWITLANMATSNEKGQPSLSTINGTNSKTYPYFFRQGASAQTMAVTGNALNTRFFPWVRFIAANEAGGVIKNLAAFWGSYGSGVSAAH